MNRDGKAKIRDQLIEKLSKANGIVLTEYRGLTVEQVTNLRVELRKAKAELRVAKNRLLKLAVNATQDAQDYTPILDQMKGPVATVFSYGDIAQVAKTLLKFSDENEVFVVKKGSYAGDVLDKPQLKAISDLPPREVLLAKLVGSLVSPHRGLVTTLSGVSRNLVMVINAIKDKKAS